jgi:hypothetical protein
MVGAPVKPTVPQTPIQPQKPRLAEPRREGGSAKRNGRPALVVRIVISLLLVWHFTGVFLAALSIAGTSPLVMNIAQRPPMQWYLDALYLNQGHSFFAPNVGPAHIIRYELQDQSGKVIEQGELPNRKLDWPRLYYHRRFMLAEQSELPIDDKPLHDAWERKYLEAFGRNLLRNNEAAQSIRLQRIVHWPLPRDLAEKGAKMTDPQAYDMQLEVVVRRSDLGPMTPPPTNQSLNWQGNRVVWPDNRTNVANRGMGVPR